MKICRYHSHKNFRTCSFPHSFILFNNRLRVHEMQYNTMQYLIYRAPWCDSFRGANGQVRQLAKTEENRWVLAKFGFKYCQRVTARNRTHAGRKFQTDGAAVLKKCLPRDVRLKWTCSSAADDDCSNLVLLRVVMWRLRYSGADVCGHGQRVHDALMQLLQQRVGMRSSWCLIYDSRRVVLYSLLGAGWSAVQHSAAVVDSGNNQTTCKWLKT